MLSFLPCQNFSQLHWIAALQGITPVKDQDFYFCYLCKVEEQALKEVKEAFTAFRINFPEKIGVYKMANGEHNIKSDAMFSTKF